MRRRALIAVLVAGASAALAAQLMVAGTAWASPSGGRVSPAVTRTRWGTPELVPGLAALNKRYEADVTSISCWGPGGCEAGGYYTDIHRHRQAFLVRENKGRWGSAAEVPATAALNQGGSAQVGSLYCARTTVCVAVGTYTDKARNTQWFTANESGGRWANAAEAPYPALNQAAIGTVWCSTGGLCAAGGWYTDPSGATQAWVRTETHGRWQPGLEVPGIAALNVTTSSYGDYVGVVSVACASSGNCAAGGDYTSTTYGTDNGFPALQAFVVTETNGTWGTAEEVPGTANMNAGGDANTTSITCPSAGDCTAAGWDQPSDLTACDPPATPNDGPGPPPYYGCGLGFVVNQRHGVWGAAGSTSLFAVSSLACPAAGDCVAAGDDEINDGPTDGALVSETNGILAGTLALPYTYNFPSVSCAAPGYCATGGQNLKGAAFVLTEWGGAWGKQATLGSLSKAAVTAVGCPAGTFLCAAGGSETVGKGSVQGFVVSQVHYTVK
jgi:hypothetical protein